MEYKPWHGIVGLNDLSLRCKCNLALHLIIILVAYCIILVGYCPISRNSRRAGGMVFNSVVE